MSANTASAGTPSNKSPRSIAQLATEANASIPYDSSQSLKSILVTTSALKKQGDKYRDTGDIERAFIDYARAATIVLERIPTHPSYQDLSQVHRSNLNLNGSDILDRIGQLKPTLSDRFEKHQSTVRTAQNTPSTSTPPVTGTSSGASASTASERVRQERAEAARRQREENDAARRRHESDARRQDAIAAAAAKRKAAEDDARRRDEADAARRREEEEAARWNLQQLETSLAASTSAARQPPQRAIQYQPPPSDDELYFPKPHPLTRPRDDDSASEFAGPSYTHRIPAQQQPSRPGRIQPDPITTTSPTQQELDHVQYPNLMSPHQRTQGYAPSLQSMFTSPPGGGGLPPPASILGDTMLGLDITGRIGTPQYPSYPRRTPYAGPSAPPRQASPQPPPLPPPPAPAPAFGYGGMAQPFVIRGKAAEYPHAPDRPPKNFDVYSSVQHGRSMSSHAHVVEDVLKSPPAVIKASELPADALPSRDLKPVTFPRETLTKFVQIASYNTSKNLETCGLLLGRLKRSGRGYVVTTLVIPRQHATSDSCTMDGEEILADYQVERDLLTLGWIHTHPTQSCFMSSVDLHTHAAYQHMLPEAFAVVCAPKSRPNFGIFRLTDPPGLQTILACHVKQAFHPHPPDVPIYTDADKGHVLMQDLPLEVADLRDRHY